MQGDNTYVITWYVLSPTITYATWRQNRPKGDDLCYECRLNCRRLLYVFRNLIKITLLLLLSLVSRPTKTINDEREEGANF